MINKKLHIALAMFILAAVVAIPLHSAVNKPAEKPKAKTTVKSPAKADAKKPVVKPLPTLVEVGSTTCVPCKMMAPIIAELRKDYKGALKVQFIDVEKNTAAAKKYKVNIIPTQIFLNSKGKEVDRHVGFFPKADILKTFSKHGIKLEAKSKPAKK